MDKKNKDNPLVQSDEDYNIDYVKNTDLSCLQKVFNFFKFRIFVVF